MARNADQQRRDQRGETHQPQREEETATEGQGERREGCAEHNNRFTRNKTKVYTLKSLNAVGKISGSINNNNLIEFDFKMF